VLINLIQNAADSIGHDGTITLRARLDSKRLTDHLTDVVVLEVTDTGRGIPPEVQKRLFDPFFSTKDSGTGLGLPIAARIVEKHGGALQYQTQVNHGTTFGIVLPRASDHDSAR
jgi:signal transduction histidine kinase